MKKMSKLLALALALVMVMGLAATAFAADEPAAYTITVNGAAGETYTAYKIFGVTYSGADANNNPTAYNYYISDSSPWYSLISDNATTLNLTLKADTVHTSTYVVTADDDFNAIAFASFLYQNIPTNADEAASGTIAENSTSVTLDVTESGAGYYFVTTSLGTVCILNTTTPTVSVNEKNSIPTSNKNITDVGAGFADINGDNAIAQLGTTVSFAGDFDVAGGTVNYVYHDTMSAGLKFDSTSVKVRVGTTYYDAIKDNVTNWTLTVDSENSNKFTVKFEDEFIASLSIGAHVYIEYSATVTSGELHTNYATNEAYLKYGNAGETTHTVVKVWNAYISVYKTDGSNPLAGAGFVLAKTDLSGNIIGYYKRVDGVVTWVETTGEASEYITNASGKLTENGAETSFTGLTNGEYLLIEKTVPSGYTRAANQTVRINDSNFTNENLTHVVTVVNTSGTVMPSTGGMGTTMLYAFGGMLVVAALVLLITKKRMAAKN